MFYSANNPLHAGIFEALQRFVTKLGTPTEISMWYPFEVGAKLRQQINWFVGTGSCANSHFLQATLPVSIVSICIYSIIFQILCTYSYTRSIFVAAEKNPTERRILSHFHFILYAFILRKNRNFLKLIVKIFWICEK